MILSKNKTVLFLLPVLLLSECRSSKEYKEFTLSMPNKIAPMGKKEYATTGTNLRWSVPSQMHIFKIPASVCKTVNFKELTPYIGLVYEYEFGRKAFRKNRDSITRILKVSPNYIDGLNVAIWTGRAKKADAKHVEVDSLYYLEGRLKSKEMVIFDINDSTLLIKWGSSSFGYKNFSYDKKKCEIRYIRYYGSKF